MSDLAALANPTYRPSKGPTCTIATLLSMIDAKEAKLLNAALANPNAPSTDIARALAGMGHPVKPYNVQRHRRGECRCGS